MLSESTAKNAKVAKKDSQNRWASETGCAFLRITRNQLDNPFTTWASWRFVLAYLPLVISRLW